VVLAEHQRGEYGKKETAASDEIKKSTSRPLHGDEKSGWDHKKKSRVAVRLSKPMVAGELALKKARRGLRKKHFPESRPACQRGEVRLNST